MAARFWVGGSGTWDAADTTHWAATSNGAGGQTVPGSSDTVTFDTNSGAAAVVTLNTSPTVQSVTRTGTVALTLTLGANTITVNTATGWSFASVTNLTVTANTATVTLTSNTGTFNSGAVNWNGLTVTTSGANTPTITAAGAFTVANLTYNGTAVITSTLTISGPFTVTGALTFNGSSLTNRALVQSSSFGTARTITLTGATVHNTNVDIRDMTFAGSPTVGTTSSVGNALGNTGVTFTAPVTRFGVAAGNFSSTAVWAATSGGAGGQTVPICHDTIVLDAASAAGTYTQNRARPCADMTCTGFTRTLAVSVAWDIYGSLTLASGMTLSGTNAMGTRGRSAHTITTDTKTVPWAIAISAGTYTFADNYTTDRDAGAAIAVNQMGVLNDGGRTVNLTAANSGVTFGSALAGCAAVLTGTWNLSSTAAATPWAVSAGCTMTTSGVTIVIAAVSASTRQLDLGAFTYGTITYTLAGSTGTLVITGAATIGTLNFSDVTNARTVTLPTTSGITIGTLWNVNGTVGKLMTVTGDVTKTTGLVISDFLSLTNSDAAGGARFYAGANSTNGGSNTGWIFTAPPQKTVAGVPIAQIKSIAGVPIGQVKKVAGV